MSPTHHEGKRGERKRERERGEKKEDRGVNSESERKKECERSKYSIFVYNPMNNKVAYMQPYCSKDGKKFGFTYPDVA